MIIGLCGRAGAGKDTFSDILIRHNSSFRKVSFARRLKDICKEVYELSEAQVSDPLGKEMTLSVPISLDDCFEHLAEVTGLEIRRQGLIARTPRQVLQFVGTDYIRSVSPDYWLACAAQEMSRLGGEDFVVTDARFPNEAQHIRSAGGKVVKIVRLAKALEEKAVQHSSEAQDFAPDYTLATVEGDFSLLHMVALCAKGGMLEAALGAANWEASAAFTPFLTAYYDELWPEMVRALNETLGAAEKQAAA